MTDKNLADSEIPTAMPGVEDDAVREKLLHDEAIEPRDEIGDDEEESINNNEPNVVRKKSTGRVLKAFAGFAIFLCLLIVAICWFFEIALFSKQKAQPVGRNASKDSQTQPVTEDEKLKMALNMVAAKEPVIANGDDNLRIAETNELVKDERIPDTVLDGNSRATTFNSGRQTANGIDSTNNEIKEPDGSLPGTSTNQERTVIGETKERVSSAKPALSNTTEPPGKSIFFGRDIKAAKPELPPNNSLRAISNVEIKIPTQNALRIPFGTLLPVRIVGSFYTFRSSGGFVRMELTRQVEGNGYKFPAGTMLVGNVRGGESTRAFVTVIGLIDPVSGNLIKFTGELLGRDGGSGIEGRKRKLSSGWSRLLRGLKDTAGTILSGAGAFRSGGTVVISDSIRRGGDSIAGEISDTLSGNRDRDGFIEVVAGSNGYVLVSDLPNDNGASRSQPKNAYSSGLSDEEFAAVLTGNSREDWRALIPKMTPEFRRLAEQAMAEATSGNTIGGNR